MTRVVAFICCLVAVLHAGPPQAPAPSQRTVQNAEPDPSVCKDPKNNPGDDPFLNPCLYISVRPGEEIDWDGPDVVTRSILDYPCFDVDAELGKFEIATEGIAAKFPATRVSYDQAMAAVRKLFASGEANTVITQLRARGSTPEATAGLDRLGVVAGVTSHPSLLFSAVFARHEADPTDPSALFNLAGALTSAGMPNEAIALLDKIAASGRQPDVAFGFKPAAAMDYLRGYASLMTGRLPEARTLLSRAYGADKTLTDASYALAITEKALGGDPRKAMLDGFLPGISPTLMYCGDQFEADPRVSRQDQEAGPEADDLLDLSKGTYGVLPQLRHPNSGEALVRMSEEMPIKAQAIQEEALDYDRRATAVYMSRIAPRFNQTPPPLQDVANQALFDLINETRASLKALQRMKADREKRAEEMMEAQERSIEQLTPKLQQLTEMGDRLTEPYKALARDIVATGLSRRRVTTNAWDTAIRRHFRNWHKYATGLAGHMTDDAWREYADLSIKAARATAWHTLYTGMIANYFAYLPAARQIYEPDAPLPIAPFQNDQLWRCSPLAQKTSFEQEFIRMRPGGRGASFGPAYTLKGSIDCDKVGLELGAELVQAELGPIKGGAGGFLEGQFHRTGDTTIYAGAKAEGQLGPMRAELKDGAAVTFDDEWNLKELALRIDPGLDLQGGPAKLKAFDGPEKITIWAAPPRAPKFDPKTRLLNYRNIN
jgi:hypothetical protein